MLQIDRLERAALLAPDLPEPSADSAVAIAIRRQATTAKLMLVVWIAGAVFMLGGVAIAPLPWVVAMTAIMALGINHARTEVAASSRRLTAPIERDVVEIVAVQTRGRYRRATVTVQNEDGGRRELVVAHDPGVLLVGDVGVMFRRADAVWDFHRVDRAARY